jgi:hypothetical protein
MNAKSKKGQLLTRKAFVIRQLKFGFISLSLIAFSLFIGSLGYHYLGKVSWIDALLNASMILTGMGPVDKMQTDTAKLFATFYSLYSGIAFLTTSAILLTPGVHRILHIIHLDDEAND